jgi:high-affinity nickel-transport protein
MKGFPALSGERGLGVSAKLGGLYLALIAANLLVWAWALLVFSSNAVLLATALLAYGFGLRHAVDADHIAAIDNVTRKMMQEGQRPVAVGFFFALGHSTVVFAASLVIALTASTLQVRFPGLLIFGGLIGTSVSAVFLFLIALVNLIVLLGVWRVFQRVRGGAAYGERELDAILARVLDRRGLTGRIFRRLFRMISRSWHMYPLGLLFGLGFDTATEIGLLGISASEASHGLALSSVLLFPALFAAGMSLIDTTDGVLMLGAHGWAFANPLRKLYYNLTITAVSVVVAVAIGGIELMGLVADRFDLAGGFWQSVSTVGEHTEMLGCVIVAIFAISWLVSFVVYRRRAESKA